MRLHLLMLMTALVLGYDLVAHTLHGTGRVRGGEALPDTELVEPTGSPKC